MKAWLRRTERSAAQLERELIQIFSPLFNVMHSLDSYASTIEYCARREAWDLVDDLTDIAWSASETRVYVARNW